MNALGKLNRPSAEGLTRPLSVKEPPFVVRMVNREWKRFRDVSRRVRAALTNPWRLLSLLIQVSLVLIALAFLGLFLVVPLVAVFVEAFRKGSDAYFASFKD